MNRTSPEKENIPRGWSRVNIAGMVHTRASRHTKAADLIRIMNSTISSVKRGMIVLTVLSAMWGNMGVSILSGHSFSGLLSLPIMPVSSALSVFLGLFTQILLCPHNKDPLVNYLFLFSQKNTHFTKCLIVLI